MLRIEEGHAGNAIDGLMGTLGRMEDIPEFQAGHVNTVAAVLNGQQVAVLAAIHTQLATLVEVIGFTGKNLAEELARLQKAYLASNKLNGWAKHDDDCECSGLSEQCTCGMVDALEARTAAVVRLAAFRKEG